MGRLKASIAAREALLEKLLVEAAELSQLSQEPKPSIPGNLQIPGLSPAGQKKTADPSPRRMAIERKAQEIRSEISAARSLLERHMRETVFLPLMRMHL